MRGSMLVGTAGWEPSDTGAWYPPGVAAGERLAWYAERFELVEVNTTFHAVPPRETVEHWVAQVPDGFRFDVKLHRLLSYHAAPPDSLPADLRDGVTVNQRGNVVATPQLRAALAERTVQAIAPLVDAGRLGALLLQLSPAFAPDTHPLEELAPLLDLLAPYRVAVELRHRGWLDEEREEETLEWLEDAQASFVCVEAGVGEAVTQLPGIDVVTRRELAYLRVLARSERIGEADLRDVATRVRALAEEADEVHAIVVTNAGGEGLAAARRLRELLGQRPAPLDAVAPGQLRLPDAGLPPAAGG
jgi:uncharacterized protein YecE (DUF72 family)